MAQWRQLEQLQKATNTEVIKGIESIYEDNPDAYKIRILCPDCVENVNQFREDDDAAIKCWFGDIINFLEKLGKDGSLAQKLEIKKLTKFLKEMYGSFDLTLVQNMRRYLDEERQLIESVQQQALISPVLIALRGKIAEVVKHQETIHLMQQDMWLSQESKSYDGQYQDQKLLTHGEETLSLVKNIVIQLTNFLSHIWDRVKDWTRSHHQYLNHLVKLPERSFEELSEICGAAGKLICDMHKLTDTVHQQLPIENGTDAARRAMEVRQELQQLLEKHVRKICVVQSHPPSTIKVESGRSVKCPMVVCLLGAASLGSYVTPSKVTAQLVGEEGLSAALTSGQVTNESQVATVSTDKVVKFVRSPKNSDLVADFTNVTYVKVKLAGRGRGVGHLMYFMVYHIELTVLQQTVVVQVSSPPIALISHHSYDCDVQGRHLWNAAFPCEKGKPFEDRDQVPWEEVAQVLNSFFLVKTGKELNQQQMEYLGHVAFKILGEKNEISQWMISRDQLTKDNLYEAKSGRKDNGAHQFSFWKWFSAAVNLLTDVLKKEWKDGLIYGFLGRVDAIELLKDKVNGTFLVRFCEKTIEQSSSAKICGCLSVAVVATSGATKNVFFVKNKFLSQKNITAKGNSLAKILHSFDQENKTGKNLPMLHCLYPDKPFYSPREKTESDGYEEQGRISITLESRSSILAVPKPVPSTVFSLTLIFNNSCTGEQKTICKDVNLTNQNIRDIEQIVGSLDAMTIAGQSSNVPSNVSSDLKRHITDGTQHDLPQESQIGCEISRKQRRSEVCTSDLTPPVSQLSPETSSDDVSLAENMDSPSMLQVYNNDVSKQLPVNTSTTPSHCHDSHERTMREVPELCNATINIDDLFTWELPPPVNQDQM